MYEHLHPGSWHLRPHSACYLPSTPLTTVPRCSKQVMEEDWVTQACQWHLRADHDQGWREAPWCELWMAGQSPYWQGKMPHPLSPWSRYPHPLPEGRVQDVCMSSCVCHCRKVMLLAQLPQTWPSVKVELRGLAAGGSERGCMAECGPQVPMRINTFLSNSPVSWGNLLSSFHPPWVWVAFISFASFKSSLKEWISNCIISVILLE